jgi:acetyl esterase/lipase
MKRSCIFLIFIFATIGSFAQKKDIIYLWPGKVPGEPKEKQQPAVQPSKNDNVLRLSEVTNPAIEVWLPAPAIRNRAACIICPGGAYSILAYDKEGTEVAAWLNKLGFAAFVLQYRVPDKQEGALQDVQRAIRIVRSNAGKWNISPDMIGVMGFSAGGSLSARASTLFNKETYTPVDNSDSSSCRPSFAMLIYPAYLDQGPNHTLTPELQLSDEVPPIFMFQTADDIVGNSSLVMAGALREAKLPVELHYLAKGGHGYGMRPGNTAAETWPLLAEKWLQGILQMK